jgi:hypothetical protein
MPGPGRPVSEAARREAARHDRSAFILDGLALGTSVVGGCLELGMAAAGGPPGLGTGIGVYGVYLERLEDLFDFGSLLSTIAADVSGGYTYFDREVLSHGVPELVIGQSTWVDYLAIVADQLIPEAFVDTAINFVKMRYDAQLRTTGPTWEVRLRFGWPILEVYEYSLEAAFGSLGGHLDVDLDE